MVRRCLHHARQLRRRRGSSWDPEIGTRVELLSPRTQADTELASAKAALLRIRIEEKPRTLVRQSDVDELIDSIAGVTLTALSGLPARCAPRGDLATRRNIERAVFEIRTEIAKVCEEMADKCGEPPLSEQG